MCPRKRSGEAAEQVKAWLRWLAVLPGALCGAVLLTVPLHVALYRTLSSFIEPYPELPERVLTPFVIAAGFVWFGALIAPARKVETALVLFGLWMVLLGASLVVVGFVGNIGGRRLYFHGGGVAPLMAFIGGVVGFLFAKETFGYPVTPVERSPYETTEPTPKTLGVDAPEDPPARKASLQQSTSPWGCPNCRLLNPPGAWTCDCGYNFRPRSWQERLAATRASTDQAALASVSQYDENQWVRRAAVERVGDPRIVEAVALGDPDSDVRRAAIERVASEAVLAQVALRDGDSQIRLMVLNRLGEEATLAAIAQNDPEWNVRMAAAVRTADQGLIASVVSSGPRPAPEAAYDAVQLLTDEAPLARVATHQGSDVVLRLAAIAKVRDHATLLRLVTSDVSPWVRAEAARRLPDGPDLVAIALRDREVGVRAAATSRVETLLVLQRIAENDDSGWVRREAIDQLIKLDAGKSPSDVVRPTGVDETYVMALCLRCLLTNLGVTEAVVEIGGWPSEQGVVLEPRGPFVVVRSLGTGEKPPGPPRFEAPFVADLQAYWPGHEVQLRSAEAESDSSFCVPSVCLSRVNFGQSLRTAGIGVSEVRGPLCGSGENWLFNCSKGVWSVVETERVWVS